jgi:hypothetical protein
VGFLPAYDEAVKHDAPQEHHGQEPQQFGDDGEPQHNEGVPDVDGIPDDGIGPRGGEDFPNLQSIVEVGLGPYTDGNAQSKDEESHGPDNLVMFCFPKENGHEKEKGWHHKDTA